MKCEVDAEPREIHFAHLDRLAPVAGKAVVDIGCGRGWLVRRLRQAGATAIGVECEPASLEAARGEDPEFSRDYIEGVGQDLPFADGAFDIVAYFQSLHHVPVEAMAAALDEARRVLRAGGILYVLEPVSEGPFYELARLIDDEREVQLAAQTHLDRVAGFHHIGDERYETTYRYRDAQEVLDDMIGVDPRRAEAARRNGERLRENFHRFGVSTGDVFAFAHPQRVRVLVKQ